MFSSGYFYPEGNLWVGEAICYLDTSREHSRSKFSLAHALQLCVIAPDTVSALINLRQ